MAATIRLVLAFSAIACATTSLRADETVFSHDVIIEKARQTSLSAYVEDAYRPPAPLDSIGYDEYRDIRFRPSRALWKGSPLSVQFFLSSFLYPKRVEIHAVENGASRPVAPSRDLFAFGNLNKRVPTTGDFAFSGFRVHGHLNRADVLDEIIAFNGASYFRALAAGHNYGLSARGLAVDTIGSRKEEFPQFKTFWIEKSDSDSVFRIHALLDSPSVAGAYLFTIRPGAVTTTDIRATLFPRRQLAHVGLAPLTSMFLFSQRNSHRFRDYRSAVHDSDGLAVATKDGETIWRPLLNPTTLQVTRVTANDVRGFGLIQRKRNYTDYRDLEARYEDRPSAWVEPTSNWGPGFVELVEIPTGAEWADNIVAFWRPALPLEASKKAEFSYRLSWRDDIPNDRNRIVGTYIGRHGDKPQFFIDYARGYQPAQGVKAIVNSSAGYISNIVVQPNAKTGGIRCFFTLDPLGAQIVDLDVRLIAPAASSTTSPPVPSAEVWTYRYMASREEG